MTHSVMLSKEAAIHLIISMIFNQSCKSEIAFKAPGELLRRLEKPSFDLYEIETKGYDVLFEIVSMKPCLQRFPANMAKYVYLSVLAINSKYDSDPRNIWRNRTNLEIIKELISLNGIGYHKAVQCLIYLNILGEISEVEKEYIEYMSTKCVGFFDNVDNDLRFIRLLQDKI